MTSFWPDLWTYLVFNPGELAFMAVKPHALYSRLLADLSVQISKTSLDRIKGGDETWPGITFKERASASIFGSLLKKWEGAMDETTKTRALEKFLKVNDQCKNWRLVDSERFGDDYLLGETKRLIADFWETRKPGFTFPVPLVDHFYDLLERGAVGPGAAIGAKGGDFYTKLFASRLSTTNPLLYEMYKRYIRAFPEWSNAESVRILHEGELDIVTSNRLDFVPKNDDISRSICIEPSLNMFYQLGLASILNSRLQSLWGINLETQQFKNRELARIGSWNGSFSTIDLSSASDSISLTMLRWLLPADFYRLLVSLRSPTSRLPNGELVELHMISTMGNGYTFPLQTIIFSAVVLSAMKMHGLAPVFPHGSLEGNFAVNGDDIVVPTEISQKVLRLLHLLGFTPNGEKTFVEGPFRESCGGDFFEGRNLRGVYIKRLDGPQDYYSVINQLNLFSTRTGILLPRLVQTLLKKVRFLPVPFWEDDSSGVRCCFSVAKRYVGVCRYTQSILYRAWTADPPPLLRIGDNYIATPRGFKRRAFNLSGLFLSILQGSVSPRGIPLIPKVCRWRTKSRIAPNWDCPRNYDVQTIQLLKGWFDWGRFESVSYLNIFS